MRNPDADAKPNRLSGADAAARATKTPVVLFAFKRPDCTAKVLAAIRIARPERLWVVADGARPENRDECRQVAAVRQLIDNGIDWPCRVERVYAETNLGCARRIISGLDLIFAREHEAIILEDDCVPDPSFFSFCGELLERYREQPCVAHIGGANFQHQERPNQYYFSRYNHVWGWATWRRAWAEYDRAMVGWRNMRRSGWLEDFLADRGAARYWRNTFERVAAGEIDTWDYQWTLTLWLRGWISISPGVNLVRNIGFDGDGVHSVPKDSHLSRTTRPIGLPLRHPTGFFRDKVADRWTEYFLYSGNLSRRAKAVIRQFVKRVFSLRKNQEMPRGGLP